MPNSPHRLRSRRGSVVVVVLGLILLAAFFLSRFIERAQTEMLVEMRAKHAAMLRSEAYSALETTLAVLADYQTVDEGLRSPAQGWGDPLGEAKYEPPAGLKVSVTLEDESGKISLPKLDRNGLLLLGAQLGLKEHDAERFADAFLAWTRREYVSTSFDLDPRQYEYANPPHQTPGRAIESFDELRAIAVVKDLLFDKDGQPNELFFQLKSSVSLYEFTTMNLNGAQAPGLVMAGLDVNQAGKIMDFNSGKGRRASDPLKYFRSITDAQALLGSTVALQGYDTSVHCLRVRVTVRQGSSSLELDAVIVPTSDASKNQQQTEAAANQASNSPAGQGTSAGSSGPLQYPFTVLALDERVELQAPPSP